MRIPIGSGLGRAWHLGGFSDLFPEGSSGKEFWSLTDRGPNLDEGVGNTCTEDGKVYPLPGFTPEIVRLGVKDEELRVKDRTPLTFAGGPAVGYSVRPAPKNEASFDENCASLGTSPRGIDSEGLVVDSRDRSFWIADEYLPRRHARQAGRQGPDACRARWDGGVGGGCRGDGRRRVPRDGGGQLQAQPWVRGNRDLAGWPDALYGAAEPDGVPRRRTAESEPEPPELAARCVSSGSTSRRPALPS